MRIGGVIYDWDLWPLRLAAGARPLSFETERFIARLVAIARALGGGDPSLDRGAGEGRAR